MKLISLMALLAVTVGVRGQRRQINVDVAALCDQDVKKNASDFYTIMLSRGKRSISKHKKAPNYYKRLSRNFTEEFNASAFNVNNFCDAMATFNQPLCPYTTKVLFWFRLHRRRRDEYCYVPWPCQQLVTYAKCDQDKCKKGKGVCMECSYDTKKIFVMCYIPKLDRCRRKFVSIRIPQQCDCVDSP